MMAMIAQVKSPVSIQMTAMTSVITMKAMPAFVPPDIWPVSFVISL